ncbi:MAG: riboflavin biosynthesis protein RibD [Verrucomicrobia bacterium 61-8]|nr:bifunctional diaminohydroxyphosphoribosylaminopyrimidine deaminase/5-amino-6-(5-phosphoribosylamino)uracil reductase RibD [Verrucomicrobiota bacterium]OJV01373.1 MAG: riboflavin biosynthesis protein RibD [Verrucomicrobia bacterium 61-8]
MPSQKRDLDDRKFMRAALAEARKGLGLTHPNPAVGAVIVAGGRIAAAGWHRGAGLPHAEIEALRALDRSPKGATIYVTLEPCSTHGRTPPCCDAIVQAGFRRVVYGATDPNPKHAGRADKVLGSHGIEVTSGMLAEECEALNRYWNKWIATGLPYVVAKAAMTLDGKIASHPESRWLSNERSRREVMKLRARMGAIMVGGETVRVDDPQLTVRGVRVKSQPLRAVWTRSGQLPASARLLQSPSPAVLFRNVPLARALRRLGEQGIPSVLLEGGGRLLGEAFDRGLVDEVCLYLAPMISGGLIPTIAGRGVGSNGDGIALEGVNYRRLGDDVCLTGRVVRN